MASFNPTVITDKGLALCAKIVAGTTKMSFTKICTSSTNYPSDTNLSALTALTSIKQTTLVSNVSVINNASVKVEGALSNASLTTGYYIYTIGLYAQDPDLGEILYSVTTAIQADWMPPNNGLSASSILIQLVTVTSNASNVEVEVDPQATATITDITNLQDQIDDLKGYVGYSEDDIIGVEVDLDNNLFTRLAGAKGLNPGTDFDAFNMYGGRRRCNLADDGTVNAYYGDSGYSVTGSNGQVMVEQPKFWYKFVPLNLIKIDGLEGLACTKFRLYLSDTYKSGFKIHPNFTRGVPALIKDNIYFAGYKGSLYDVSASAYLMNDEQVGNFTASTGDKLCSISGVKPASGLTQNLTRANTRIIAANRGTGFQQADLLSNSCTQMLFLVEYASADSQTKIGMGVTTFTDDESSNMSVVNGACNSFGNGSGMANGDNGKVSITYRGEENFWGNLWSWEDGLNIECKDLHNAFFALGNFSDDIKTTPYKDVGFQLAKSSGYVNAIGWSEQCDFAFLAMRTTGASNKPLNDYFYQNAAYNGFMVSLLGGSWDGGSYAGAFCRDVSAISGYRGRDIGGRLLFVPSGGKEVI